MFGGSFDKLCRVAIGLCFGTILLRAQSPIVLSTTALDFGDVQAGQSVTQTVTVTNNSAYSQYVVAQLAGIGLADFEESNQCSYTDEMANETFLDAGASCTITVVFTPVIAGTVTPQVNIVATGYNTESQSPFTINLVVSISGTGIGGSTLAASVSTFNFGGQFLFQPYQDYTNIQNNPGVNDNPGPTYHFKIGNPTTAPLAVPALDQSTAPEFLVSDDCPATLDVNATCDLYVVFMSQGLGARHGTVYVGAPPNGTSISFTGTGLPPYQNLLITNVLSGKTLDITNASSADGARIQQWAINGNIQQQWTLTQNGSNYEIVSPLSNDVLDVTNASMQDGAVIQQWSADGGEQQDWNISSPSGPQGGFSTIINLLSSKVLDVTGASEENGATIQQWSSNGYAQQSWQLVNAQGFNISNASSGSDLDATGGSSADGTPIQQWAANGLGQQIWYLVPVGGGYFKIQNYLTGKVLDVTNASMQDGAVIQQWDYNGYWQQQWKLQPAGLDSDELFDDEPYYYFVNRLTGKVLEVAGDSSQNGALIEQATLAGTVQQRWSLNLGQAP